MNPDEVCNQELKALDISSEKWREYVYANGEVYKIETPITLYVKSAPAGDSHRVVDGAGIAHYPRKGWIAIRWFSPTRPVAF